MPIVFKHVGFEWPSGNSVFEDLSFSLSQKIYALTGINGVGKTTLARLIAGELEPTNGSIVRSAIGYFPQFEDPPDCSVGEYLIHSENLIAHEVLETFDRSRICSTLSGGEWTRTRLAKVLGSNLDFLILDEPTNHLDREGRLVVHDFLEKTDLGILLISHDRELLALAEEILELTSHGIAQFGFGWGEYVAERDRERSRLHDDLERAKSERERVKRKRHEKVERQEKRRRQGKKKADKGGIPRIAIGGLKRRAETTLAKIDVTTQADLDEAVRQSWKAYESLKVDPVMYARLPEVKDSTGKTVLEMRDFNFRYRGTGTKLWMSELNHVFRAPARISIRGLNGSGKSTLLQLLKGEILDGETFGEIRAGNLSFEFLSQDHSSLNGEQSIFENVQESARMSESEIRGHLATFLFKADFVHRKVSTLSGGERLRCALAKVLITDSPPELLVLDEPTNNLDLANIEFLEELLCQYRGSLIVVSHDDEFLRRLKLDDEIELR